MQRITIGYESSQDIDRAAELLAKLAGQGLSFRAFQDGDNLVIEITGC